MCGIAGVVDPSRGADDLGLKARQMADTLVHRGPDSSGVWSDEGVGFAHRRLAIIDLTPAGHQPMVSSSGRFVITFNGEIYNFHDLRRSLESEGAHFTGHSDTEVLLQAVESWGVRKALGAAVGMFAFGLWDRHERTLVLARDRLGEKPLYWASDGRRMAFGSELRAVRQVDGLCGKVDADSIMLFLRHNYVPSPRTIFTGVRKLAPGTMLTARFDGGCAIEECAYWSVSRAYEAGAARPFLGSIQDAVQTLEGLFRNTIRDQMISDVPIGAFLSGGIDSSTIVALMQSESPRPIRTFTIGFREGAFNEAAAAEDVAKHLGTQHTTMYVTPKDALDVIPKLPAIYDEPFADSSQIPTCLLSALTRRHVTVALSGDGGDELFCGYNRYLWARTLWRALSLVPLPLRRLAAGALRGASPAQLDRFLTPAMKVLPRRLRMPHAGERLAKLAASLDVSEPSRIYLRFLSHWNDPGEVTLSGMEPETGMSRATAVAGVEAFTRYMMRTDSGNYLPDDIMVKVDRASMAVSLESRVPMLDHRIFEFAATLPVRYLVHGREGKQVLRHILYRHVPKSLVDRPKTGFGIPLEAWLRGPLREWASDLLAPSTLRRQGIFNPAVVDRHWQEHLSGSRAWHYPLWDVLMLTAWMEDGRLSLS
jgi:asparagine synthase (glutamine-hydrolysing)